jgi:putative ABC transport system permease protein
MLMTVCLGCIVGVSVVAQTLYTSTIDHLKEFATVKAIGGTNADIYAIIGKQAAIAALAGFAIGAAMAYGLRPVMASIDLRLALSPPLAISVFLGTLALCLASAVISCRKVATLDPALVFRG